MVTFLTLSSSLVSLVSVLAIFILMRRHVRIDEATAIGVDTGMTQITRDIGDIRSDIRKIVDALVVT